MEQAVRIDSWPWGEASDGLQVALLLSRSKVGTGKSFVREPGSKKAELRYSSRIEYAIALRNTSDKPLRVNLTPADKCLSLTGSGPEGKIVSADLYRGEQAADPALVAEIPAGELLFVDAQGVAKWAGVQSMSFAAGAWKLTAGYGSSRVGTDGAMWLGAIRSAEVDLEVEAFGVRHRPPGGPTRQAIPPGQRRGPSARPRPVGGTP